MWINFFFSYSQGHPPDAKKKKKEKSLPHKDNEHLALQHRHNITTHTARIQID